jgi:hypothetical protein
VVAARPLCAFKHTLGGGAAKARWKWRVPSAPSRRWMIAAGRKMANRSGNAQLGILPSGGRRRSTRSKGRGEKDLPAGKSFMALLNRAYVSTCTRFAADVSRICSAKTVNVSGICSTGLTSVQFAQPL